MMDIHISVYEPEEMELAAHFMGMLAHLRRQQSAQHRLAQPDPYANLVPPGLMPAGAGPMGGPTPQNAADYAEAAMTTAKSIRDADAVLDAVRKGNAVMDKVMRDTLAYGIGVARVDPRTFMDPGVTTNDEEDDPYWAAIKAASKP
jgi:hypothetical protein